MPRPRAERAHNYDEVAELVAERVAKSQGRMSAKRMLPIARAAGYDGSARNFRRLVAEAKRLWRSEHHRGRRPAVWSPGEYLVIDWAQAAAGLFLFCAVLAFSRWRFVAFATDQKASTTLALIAEAFGAAALRESATIIALAWPSSTWATLSWKCSTMTPAFWSMVCGLSFTPAQQAQAGGITTENRRSADCSWALSGAGGNLLSG
jgi:hypothetical protein